MFATLHLITKSFILDSNYVHLLDMYLCKLLFIFLSIVWFELLKEDLNIRNKEQPQNQTAT